MRICWPAKVPPPSPSCCAPRDGQPQARSELPAPRSRRYGMQIDTTFLTVGALMLLAGYGVTIYNSLVRLKHQVAQAWANIDVLLKQRHDELPKLVDTCRQYMEYERDT